MAGGTVTANGTATAATSNTLPPFDFSKTEDWGGGRLLGLNGSMLALTTIWVFLRLYVRAFMTKSLGLDDLLISVAWAASVVHSSLAIWAVYLGSGAHIDQIPLAYIPKFFELLTTQNLFHFWVICLVHLAVVAFLIRLSKEKSSDFASLKPTEIFRYCVYTIALANVGLTIGCFVYRLTRCDDIQTYNMSILAFWTDLEVHTAIWCACFPALQPLIRFIAFMMGLRSKLESYPGAGAYKNSSGGAVISGKAGGPKSGGGAGAGSGTGKWQVLSKHSSNGYIRKGSGIDSDQDSRKDIIPTDNDSNAVELNDLDIKGQGVKGKILKRTDIKVQVNYDPEDGRGPQKSWVAM